VPTAPDDRVQLVPGVKSPEPLLVKDTTPVGLVAEELVSVMVAVHSEALFTDTELGVQARDVVVKCSILTATVRVALFFTRVPEVALMTTWYVVDKVGDALKVIVEVWVAPPVKVTLLGL
jgi:hypothetical protein